MLRGDEKKEGTGCRVSRKRAHSSGIYFSVFEGISLM
jgi:hypothetical protein